MFKAAEHGFPVVDYEELIEHEEQDETPRFIGVYMGAQNFLEGMKLLSDPNEKLQHIRELKRQYGNKARVYAISNEINRFNLRFTINKGKVRSLETYSKKVEVIEHVAEILRRKFGEHVNANVVLSYADEDEGGAYVYSITLFD
jgi:hypothetical protein